MYDQFYGFSGRPFQLTPDPQFYFESNTHRKALSYLGYGLAQGEGFIVITGEVGSGKSTLVGHLMNTVDKGRMTAVNIVTSQLDGHDMVQMAAESFGIATTGTDKAATLKAIEDFLHSEARAGRRCLLIVDEAQNLSVDALEELRMLSNFQLGSQALLQIFLLGQPECRDLLQSSAQLEQLRQRVIATHHLDAMEADEIEPYVIHRLSRVGWAGRPQIEAGVFAKLYAETNGIPRKINTLMNRVLLMASVEQVNVIDAALVSAVVADMAGKPFEYTAPVASMMPQEEEAVQATEMPEPEAAALGLSVTEEVNTHTGSLAEFAEATEAADDNGNESRLEPQFEETSFADLKPAEDHAAFAAPFSEPSEPTDGHSFDEIQHDNNADRIAALEARVAEQDAALRRMLCMMIEWMDKEQAVLDRRLDQARAA